MSSRKEEKERLRREREEAERAAQQSDTRRQRISIVLGALVVIAAIVVAVVLLAGGGDDSSDAKKPEDGSVAVPDRKITDLDEAAKAAGCKINEYPSEGRGHTSSPVKYKTNPPTSGNHDPTPAQDGVYESAPKVEQSVHTLEHGRVEVQYKPGTPQKQIDQLEAMVGEKVQGTGGYHTLLFPNATKMPSAVAVTSWTRSLTCPTFNDKVFDAIRAFREKAIVGEWAKDIPEQIP